MITKSLRIGKQIVPINSAILLYIFAGILSLLTLYIIGPALGITFRSWAEYYRALGQLLGIWGILFAVAFSIIVGYLILRSLITTSAQSLILRLTTFDIILLILFILNLGWFIIAMIFGNPISYTIGDTIRGMFIPVIYWIVRKNITTYIDALFFTKLIIYTETIILMILIPTGYIPFSVAGRTFLTTVFFTLLFEEKNIKKRLLYLLIFAFGIFVVFTTQAQRGIIIILFIIILMNFYFKIQNIRISILIFAFVLPLITVTIANEMLDLGIEKEVEITETRFQGSTKGKKMYFGLDESIFQRVGETIDVWETFSNHSPIYAITGFGHGAVLTNKLITPSERSVYKTNVKHHIYITIVAILYRNGILGIIIYGAIVLYIMKILMRIRKYRDILQNNSYFIYLKVMCLYQVSVMFMSFLTYSYIGNIVIAFTLPLIEILRRKMEEVIYVNKTHNIKSINV